MEKKNYQKELDLILNRIENDEPKKRLLLHACCAPCSSYVLEYLTKYFDITVFFYNPNITSAVEYKKRYDELKRLISVLPHENKITLIDGGFDAEVFYVMAKGKEEIREGGARCFECYRLRLEKTAELMKSRKNEFDYFATTLTVSPHKNSDKLNEIGFELSEKYSVDYLPSDFKKKNGYKRSIELSDIYDLYRQNFCGCEYSRKEAENRFSTDCENLGLNQ